MPGIVLGLRTKQWTEEEMSLPLGVYIEVGVRRERWRQSINECKNISHNVRWVFMKKNRGGILGITVGVVHKEWDLNGCQGRQQWAVALEMSPKSSPRPSRECPHAQEKEEQYTRSWEMSVLDHSVLSLLCDFGQFAYVLGQFSSSEQSG